MDTYVIEYKADDLIKNRKLSLMDKNNKLIKTYKFPDLSNNNKYIQAYRQTYRLIR